MRTLVARPSPRPFAASFALALAATLPVAFALAVLAASPRAAIAQAEAEEAPEPPPLTLRTYEVAWAHAFDRSPDALFECAPERGLRADPAHVFRSPWEEPDGLGAVVMFSEPGGAPTMCWEDPLKELLEQHVSNEPIGSFEYLNGALFVRTSEASQVRIARFLTAMGAAFARRVTVSVRLVVLPTGEPSIVAADPEALGAVASARGRALGVVQRSLEMPSWGARFQVAAGRATALSLRANRSGPHVVLEPFSESLPSGIDIDVGVHETTASGHIRLRVRAGEVAIDAIERRRAFGAELDLPVRAERSALSVVEVADGGVAAIVLGPRSASETAVLIVSAKADGPTRAGVRDLPASTAGMMVAILDASPALTSVHERDTSVSPDVLIEILKGAAGGDESWREGTSIESHRGRFFLTNTPAVISQSAAIIRDLGERARPRRCDAWLLEARSLGSLETGAIGAASAEALLARAAKKDGVTLAARFGGGLAARGALFARSRTETRFLGGVDTISLGTPSATATLRVPITAAVDAGIAFEARLERAGDAAASGAASRLVLEAKATIQTVDMTRTARVPLEGSEAIDVALPVLARREVAGRAEFPSAGGWALIVAEAAPGSAPEAAHALLLVRVGP